MNITTLQMFFKFPYISHTHYRNLLSLCGQSALNKSKNPWDKILSSYFVTLVFAAVRKDQAYGIFQIQRHCLLLKCSSPWDPSGLAFSFYEAEKM